jgi:hypothetical protein
MKTHLILLPLLAGGSAALATAFVPATEALRSIDDYATLSAEYDAAYKAHRQAIRDAADKDERRALRAKAPIHDYWPRFAALAEGGDGQAVLWMIAKVKDKGLKRTEQKEEKTRLYAILRKDHVAAPWFGEAIEQMRRDGKLVGVEALVATYEAVIEKNPDKGAQAQAMYHLAKHLMDDPTEERRAAGMRWFEKVAGEEFQGTEYGKKADNELYEVKYLGVGCVAPDFDGATIDGHEFKLSDYRGKVVLLDFYGFW